MFGFFAKPSRAAFAKLLLEAARRAGIDADYQLDEGAFTLHQGSKRFFLGNFYAEYNHADRARKKILLANFVAVLGQKEETISREKALTMAVAVVREQALFSFTELNRRIETDSDQPFKIAMEPISDWFAKAVVLDFPQYVKVVASMHLAEWGLTFDELFAIGLQRLADCSGPKFRPENGFFAGTWSDDYDSSRILLPGLFDDLPLEGPPVVCTPNRLTLLVADAHNPAAVAAMLQKAEEITKTLPRPINPAPLTYRDGKLVAFEVPRDSPLFHPVHRARAIAGGFYYSQQKTLLEALHKKTGKDLFVATFNLRQLDSDGYFCYSVWSKGVPTLLPKTDHVIFFDPSKPEARRTVATVPWEKVHALLGHMMLDTEMFPPLYYVSRFPSEEDFQQLAADPSPAPSER